VNVYVGVTSWEVGPSAVTLHEYVVLAATSTLLLTDVDVELPPQEEITAPAIPINRNTPINFLVLLGTPTAIMPKIPKQRNLPVAARKVFSCLVTEGTCHAESPAALISTV
jgi:hypothetical protein